MIVNHEPIFEGVRTKIQISLLLDKNPIPLNVYPENLC
jgi:hypothetical protein